jgi:hypothetical protein
VVTLVLPPAHTRQVLRVALREHVEALGRLVRPCQCSPARPGGWD